MISYLFILQVRIWLVSSSGIVRLTQSCKEHRGSVTSLHQLASDGNLLLSCGTDGRSVLWQLP